MATNEPALAIQGALVAAIKAISPATAAGANVFDTVPTTDPFPRVTIGLAESNPVTFDCYDGTETFMQVDVWSRKPGYPEVKTIAGAIRDRLHYGALTLVDHYLEEMAVENTLYRRDPDGLTSRAIMRVRLQTRPLP